MRTLMLAGLAGLMLAGPALADERGDRDREGWRGDHQDWRDDRRHWRDERYSRTDRRDEWRWQGSRDRGPGYAYPQGYGYRPWTVGYRLPPPYWGQRYWIANPGIYRLPPAWGGTRWVRVGPDALLIRVFDGTIVRAVRGLYW